jgi:hypothetical protein
MVLFCAALIVFSTIYLGKLLYKLWFTTKRSKQLHSHLPQLVSVVLVMLRFLYMYLTRTTLE